MFIHQSQLTFTPYNRGSLERTCQGRMKGGST